MTNINIIVPDEEYYNLKVICAKSKITVKSKIISLIKKEVEKLLGKKSLDKEV